MLRECKTSAQSSFMYVEKIVAEEETRGEEERPAAAVEDSI